MMMLEAVVDPTNDLRTRAVVSVPDDTEQTLVAAGVRASAKAAAWMPVSTFDGVVSRCKTESARLSDSSKFLVKKSGGEVTLSVRVESRS